MKEKELALLCILLFVMNSCTNQTSVEELQVIPKKVLDTSGFSGDIALSPVDHSLHVIWVNSGDIRYVLKSVDGSWGAPENVPDGGREVYGQEEDGNWPRKCAAITVDTKGYVHVIFSERAGNIYYLNRKSGTWSNPEQIVSKDGYSIYLDIVAVDDRMYAVYEDADRDQIYSIAFQDGSWGDPLHMGVSEYPSLAVGDDGTVYFLCRNDQHSNYNARFAYLTKDSDEWVFVEKVTDAPRRLGAGPGLMARGGKIYLAWSNSTGIDGPAKSGLFCAVADVPGNNWITRLGGDEPLYYENTGDPHPRVAIYSNGSVLYMNGKSLEERFMFWNGQEWSDTRTAPWQSEIGGTLQVECDGRTAWVIFSPSGRADGEVSVSGIVNPVSKVDKTYQDLTASKRKTK